MWVVLSFIFSNLFTCLFFSIFGFLKGFKRGEETEKELQKQNNEVLDVAKDLAKYENEVILKMRNCLNCGNGKSTGICKLPFGECINMSCWEMKK